MANIKKTNNLIIGNVTLDLVDDEAHELIDTLRSDVESDIEDIRSDVSEDIADIRSDVSDDISVIDARVDNLVTDVNGAETVTLWNGSMSADGGTYTLSQSVSNFDFIDIYYDNQYTGVADYLRIPANKASAAVYIPFFETGKSSNKQLEIGKVALTFSGTSVTVAAAKQWWWDGTNEDNATIINAQNSFPVRIDGIKSSASVNAELADVRVGADGVTYANAGAAVRGQISDVKNDLNALDALEEVSYTVNWSHGTIDLTYGQDSVSNTRIRTDIHDIGNKTIKAESGSKYAFRFYTSNGSWIPAPSGISYTWLTGENKVSNISAQFPNAEKFRIIVAYSNDTSTATTQEMNDLIEKISIIYVVSKINRIDYELDDISKISDVLNWKLGTIGVNNGIDGNSTTRIRTFGYIEFDETAVIEILSGAKYNIFTYDKDKEFISAFGTWQTISGNIKDILITKGQTITNCKYIRIDAAYSDDATVYDVPTLGAYIKINSVGNFQKVYDDLNKISDIEINTTGLGNFSIRCAKEQSYIDGTSPVIEWFLLEEPNSGRFFYSKDLKNKKYLFTFPYDTYRYSFGVLQNGDVIACLDADSIATENKSDANRENPYVFLASENWTVCHEVNFGSSLKPCGWLSNCGFKVLADGSAIFCEYTRQTTYTANVWKLSGDPTDPLNWVVTKSFVVTSTDNSTGFKHCHMVMQDFYTGICYMSTGDDNIGSMLFYSNDNGETWTQLQSPDSDGQVNEYGWITGSEKYCRALTFTFTEDYIYWSSDTPTETYHYLFRVERDENGVFDFSTVTEIVNLPNIVGASTYGTAYIPEYDAILLLERTDALAQEMDIRMVLLSTGTLISIGKLYVTTNEATTGANLGFRTRFSEWYPVNGLVRVGFGLRGNHYNNDVNHNKGFGNTGTWIIGGGSNNINNLSVQVFRNGDSFGMKLNTHY